MTYTRWIRIVLGYLALVSAQIGIWAALAPRSFYDDFPGLGRTWISTDGPYNEHLVRDVGALNLALMVLAISAAITMSRDLIHATALTTLVWGVLHLLYHLFNTAALPTSDAAMSLGGLALSSVAPIALIVITKRINAPVRPATVVS